MGDSDESNLPAGIPDWQKAQTAGSRPPATTAAASEDKKDIARRFLDDEEVKNSSREKKVEFLKAKGLGDAEVEELLAATQSAPGQQEEVSTPYPPFSRDAHIRACR
jgi:hypothetical protein